VAHATPYDPPYRERLASLSRHFASSGFSAADAAVYAKAQLAHVLLQQASFLSFLDCFWMLGCACLIGAPLVFLTRKIKSAQPGAAH
jgi:DHA2 family multidrug resistance protein